MSGQRMMQHDSVDHCIKPGRSYWLTGILGRGVSRHLTTSTFMYLTGTTLVLEMRQVLILRNTAVRDWRVDAGKVETGRSLPASAAHNEGNRSHPGWTVRKSDWGEGRLKMLALNFGRGGYLCEVGLFSHYSRRISVDADILDSRITSYYFGISWTRVD